MTDITAPAPGHPPSTLIRAFGYEDPDAKTLEANVWRTVEIHPGQADDPVVIQQHLAFNPEHLIYDVVACNITEGRPKGEVRLLDGRVVELEEDLCQMLYHLRLPNRARAIWTPPLWYVDTPLPHTPLDLSSDSSWLPMAIVSTTLILPSATAFTPRWRCSIVTPRP